MSQAQIDFIKMIRAIHKLRYNYCVSFRGKPYHNIYAKDFYDFQTLS